MRLGMVQLLAVNLLNIFLNLLFVLGLGWEVAGVAWLRPVLNGRVGPYGFDCSEPYQPMIQK